jgi:hypothetical protein
MYFEITVSACMTDQGKDEKIVINSMKLKDYLFLSTNITLRLITTKAKYKL